MSNMEVIGKEAFVHLVHIHSFLSLLVKQEISTVIKMSGKMKISFLILERDRVAIWNLLEVTYRLEII